MFLAIFSNHFPIFGRYEEHEVSPYVGYVAIYVLALKHCGACDLVEAKLRKPGSGIPPPNGTFFRKDLSSKNATSIALRII